MDSLKDRLVFLLVAAMITVVTSQQSITQWVSSVVAYSSQWDSGGWAAKQVIGSANVYPKYGDIEKTWAQLKLDKNQYIKVRFSTEVIPTGIDIYETYNAGGVKKISAFVLNPTTGTTDTYTLYSTTTVKKIKSSRIFKPTLANIGMATNTLQIYIDCSVSKSWVEIDAIKLYGTVPPPPTTTAPPTTLTPPTTLNPPTTLDSNSTVNATSTTSTTAATTTTTGLPVVYVCADGYTGPACTIAIDCNVTSVCSRFGTCIDGFPDVCFCAPGYTGSTCAIAIDCAVVGVCANGGTCIDGSPGQCVCADGYSGSTCAVDCWDSYKYFDSAYMTQTYPIRSKTNTVLEVTGNVLLKPHCALPVIKTWTLTRVLDCSTTVKTTSSTTYVFSKNTVLNELYKLSLDVAFSSYNPRQNFTDYVYVVFELPELVTKITDGISATQSRTVLRNSSVKIDSSESYDPADPINENSALASVLPLITRSWSCKTGTMTASDIYTYFIVNNGVLPSGATMECSYLFPSLNQEMYTFPANTFVQDQYYIITLTLARGTRNATKSQAILAKNLPPLSLEIECIGYNCFETASDVDILIEADLQLNVAIRDTNVDNTSATYVWTFLSFNSDTKVFDDVSYLIEGSRTGSGFKVPASALIQPAGAGTNVAKYQVSCDVLIPGYSPTKIFQSYVMNFPPYGGSCSITGPDENNEAVAGETTIFVECSNWVAAGNKITPSTDDNGGYLHYVVTQLFLQADGNVNLTAQELLKKSDEKPSSSFKLAKPDMEINALTRIDVKIRDKVLTTPYALQSFSIRVKAPLDDNLSGITGGLTVDKFASSKLPVIEHLLNIGYLEKAVCYEAETISLFDFKVPVAEKAFNSQTGDKLPDGSFLSAETAMDEFAEPVKDPVTVASINTNVKLASILKNVSFANSVLVSTGDKMLSSEFIGSVVSAVALMCQNPKQNLDANILNILNEVSSHINADLTTIVSESSDPSVPDLLEDSLYMLVSCIKAASPDGVENLLDISNMQQARKRHKDMSLFDNAEEKEDRENREMSESELTFFSLHTDKELKLKVETNRNVARTACDNFDTFVGMSSNLKLSNGASTKLGDYDNSSAEIVIRKDIATNLEKASFRTKTTTISVPGLASLGQKIMAVALGEAHNVHPLDEGASRITSSYKVLKLNTREEITGRIKIKHKVPVATYTSIKAAIDPEDASGFSYHLVYVKSANDMLCLSIPPTSENIERIKIWISDYKSGVVSKINVISQKEASVANDYTECFSPQQRPGKEAGVWSVGFEPIIKDNAANSRKRRAATNDTSGDITFNLAIATMACMIWDTDESKWTSDRCDGKWLANNGSLLCDCFPQKEMTFANSFYVPPNTIDFSSVFLKFSPLNQAAVLATISLIAVVYSLVILWARHQDKKDLLKWGITPLSDNFVQDQYFYVVRVYTGIRPGAGTKSRPSFVIAGDKMDTEVRELADGVRKTFKTGSVMNFLMSTSEYLGDLDYISIWHDNSGGGNDASWYLSKIEVQDIQRNEIFVFMADRWLAVEKGNGSLTGVIPVSTTTNINVFKNRFLINAKENLAESHMWISVVYRPQSSNFTRAQRASCALVFVMLTMIANAMFFKTSDTENYETPSELQVGPFRFSTRQIYISLICALITTPATIMIIYLFKMARAKPVTAQTVFQSNESHYKLPFVRSWLEKEQMKSVKLEKHLIQAGYPQSQGFFLPYWCVYVAWLLVVAATVCSAFFIVLYSMEWGKQKSEEWLTTFLMSFFESVFCLDLLKIGIMALMFALLFRSVRDSSAVIDRQTVMKKYASCCRRHSGVTRLPAPPLDKRELNKARAVRAMEMQMQTALKDTFVNLVIMWILFSISYSNRDVMSNYMRQDIMDTILEPMNQQIFSAINTTSDYFEWLNRTAIINLFPETDINGDRLHWRQRQFAAGGTKFRVGPPRLRQMRAPKESCANPYMKSNRRYCVKQYSMPTEDTNSYCIGWNRSECDPKEKVYQLSADAWEFTPALDIWGMPIGGLYTTYGGGGFIAKLSVNREVSQLIIDELYINSWVDRQTRSVLFEFTLYCLNANIFTYNMFMVEFPETGGAIPFYSILPLRVYQHIGSLGYYTLACEIIFAIYVCVCTVMACVGVFQQRRSYFRGWQLYDFVFLILSYVAVVMYSGRLLMTNKAMQVFKDDKKEFVNFYHIAIWDIMFVELNGILVFLATLRLLNTLGYNRRIGAIARVFTSVGSELIWFGIFFVNVLTCYAVFGYLVFGSKLPYYASVYKAMGTLFISIIGKSRFTEIEETDPAMSKVYFLSFTFFVVYMILTMFLAILSKAIDKVHRNMKTNKGAEMVDHMLQRLSGILAHIGGGKSRINCSVQPEVFTTKTALEDIRMAFDKATNCKRKD